MIPNKLISVFIAVILLFVACTGCGQQSGEKNTHFISKDAMQSELESGFWVSHSEKSDESGNLHYRFCVFSNDKCLLFDLSRKSGTTLDETIESMLSELERQGESVEFDSITDFFVSKPKIKGYTIQTFRITYFPEEGLIRSVDGSASWEINSSNIIDNSHNAYYKSKYLSALDSAFTAYQNKKNTEQKNIFLQKYKDSPNYTDVKYSPYSYIGSDFIITGSAELDDYYNYDYRDLESVYFCICVTPAGGGYTDRWYIYCRRGKYDQLLERLKKGPVSSITLICNGFFPDSLKEEMADLVDYYIG